MATDSFSDASAQKQIFDALPEGLPQPLEAKPAPFPRRGRKPIPLPRGQRRQIIQAFDPLSENYVAEPPPVRRNMPEWLANAETVLMRRTGGKLLNGVFFQI